MISPCRNCESRYVGCHSDCPAYINFAHERCVELTKRNAYNYNHYNFLDRQRAFDRASNSKNPHSVYKTHLK